METSEAKFVLPDVCLMCGKAKPCVLHDRLYRDALLGEEQKKFNKLEQLVLKVREWDLGIPMAGQNQMAVMSETVAIALRGDTLFRIDTAKDEAERLSFDTESITPNSILPAAHNMLMAQGWRNSKNYFGWIDLSESPLMMKELGEVALGGAGAWAALSDENFLISDTEGHLTLIDAKQRPPKVKPAGRYTQKRAIKSIFPLSESEALISGGSGEVKLWERRGQMMQMKDLVARVGDNVYGLQRISPTHVRVLGIDTSVRLSKFGQPKYQPVETCLDVSSRPFRVSETPPEYEFSPQAVYLAHDCVLDIDPETARLVLIYLGDPSQRIFPQDPGAATVSLLARLSPTRALVTHQHGVIELWEISEDKLRAYHERQLAKTDEPVPELPDV